MSTGSLRVFFNQKDSESSLPVGSLGKICAQDVRKNPLVVLSLGSVIREHPLQDLST